MKTLKKVLILSATLPCLILESAAQERCGCGSYADVAMKAGWYTSSSSSQKMYVQMLSLLDKNFDELKRSIGASADADWITGTVSANFNQEYYEQHKHEIAQRIETKLDEESKNDTHMQYPIELIHAMEGCYAGCLSGTDITCRAFATDDHTAVFSVDYHTTLSIPAPKFTQNVHLPEGVKAIQSNNHANLSIKDQSLSMGANLFPVDRTERPDAFTLTFTTNEKQCYATAPTLGKSVVQNSGLKYTHECDLSAGFALLQADSFTNDVVKRVTCTNMPPGGKFIAIFKGRVVLDSPVSEFSSWVDIQLGSSLVQEPANARRLDHDKDEPFELSIKGAVPAKSVTAKSRDIGGEVTVEVRLKQCQTGANPKSTCSTKGDAIVTIIALDPDQI